MRKTLLCGLLAACSTEPCPVGLEDWRTWTLTAFAPASATPDEACGSTLSLHAEPMREVRAHKDFGRVPGYDLIVTLKHPQKCSGGNLSVDFDGQPQNVHNTGVYIGIPSEAKTTFYYDPAGMGVGRLYVKWTVGMSCDATAQIRVD